MSPHGQGERKDLANPAHVGHFIPAFFRECLEFSHTWSFGFPCGAGGKEPACQGRRCTQTTKDVLVYFAVIAYLIRAYKGKVFLYFSKLNLDICLVKLLSKAPHMCVYPPLPGTKALISPHPFFMKSPFQLRFFLS